VNLWRERTALRLFFRAGWCRYLRLRHGRGRGRCAPLRDPFRRGMDQRPSGSRCGCSASYHVPWRAHARSLPAYGRDRTGIGTRRCRRGPAEQVECRDGQAQYGAQRKQPSRETTWNGHLKAPPGLDLGCGLEDACAECILLRLLLISRRHLLVARDRVALRACASRLSTATNAGRIYGLVKIGHNHSLRATRANRPSKTGDPVARAGKRSAA
jgi:hypothetical protein